MEKTEQSIKNNKELLKKISGIWSDREDIADSEKYVRKLREGWRKVISK